MQFLKINNRLTLHKENGQMVNVDEGDVITYTARYYNVSQNVHLRTYTVTDFIGIVTDYRYNQDEGYTGIYVQPFYVWNTLENEWNKIVNLSPYPQHQYFVYPHLLMLPQFDYHYHPLYFLHTCENVALQDYTHCNRTMDIEQPYGKGMSYNYTAMKTRTDTILEELMREALHPRRIDNWIEID